MTASTSGSLWVAHVWNLEQLPVGCKVVDDSEVTIDDASSGTWRIEVNSVGNDVSIVASDVVMVVHAHSFCERQPVLLMPMLSTFHRIVVELCGVSEVFEFHLYSSDWIWVVDIPLLHIRTLRITPRPFSTIAAIHGVTIDVEGTPQVVCLVPNEAGWSVQFNLLARCTIVEDVAL